MNKKDFEKLGNECIEHLTALNPRGGVKKVIEFYTQAIIVIKNLSDEELQNTDFAFLKNIDSEIGMKYDIEL